jgi:hypothetical protein
MATLGTTALTLSDWGERVDANGKIPKIVEMLNVENEILDDMLWVQGNLPTGHKTTIRSGLPSATWRMLNYGVQPSKSRTVQVTDSCGMLEAYSVVDKSLAELNGNSAEFRLSEDMPFYEALRQSFASTLFYGNTATNPERFLGLSARYSTKNTANAENAINVLDGGGTAATNTSIWLVVWSENTAHGIFPKGSKAGLSMQDLGERPWQDASNGTYQAYVSHYKWDCGFALRDWRYVVRIANVDVTQLTKNASAGADLVDLMTQALERVKSLTGGTPVFYVDRTIRSFLRRQIVNKTVQSTLAFDTVGGKRVVVFGEVPVKRVDALLNTEPQVV